MVRVRLLLSGLAFVARDAREPSPLARPWERGLRGRDQPRRKTCDVEGIGHGVRDRATPDSRDKSLGLLKSEAAKERWKTRSKPEAGSLSAETRCGDKRARLGGPRLFWGADREPASGLECVPQWVFGCLGLEQAQGVPRESGVARSRCPYAPGIAGREHAHPLDFVALSRGLVATA